MFIYATKAFSFALCGMLFSQNMHMLTLLGLHLAEYELFFFSCFCDLFDRFSDYVILKIKKKFKHLTFP